MKIYCHRCNKPTNHRQKLGGIVCNTCDITNYLVFLQRIGDNRSNIGSKVLWVEWTEEGRGKAVHNDPQIGFSLCLDPYSIKSDHPELSNMGGYGWLTTGITEIIEDTISKEYRKVHFKTKNSEYVLHVTTLKK
jgi:hypothetical protein